MDFVRYLRVAFLAVRTTRSHHNHYIGHLKCNAELAAPWNSRRVAENALSLYDGPFVEALVVCTICTSEMHLDVQG